MAKFFEGLANKLLDFLNFGRLITIFVPGLIVALCVSMLVSQMIWPTEKSPAPVVKVTTKDSKETILESKKNEASKKETETITTTKDSAYKENADQKTADKKVFFSKQVSEDYHRVYNNPFAVGLLTIVLGLIIYEIGFRIFLYFPDKGKQKLHRYDPAHDSDPAATYKFTAKKDEPAGLVYFAPFLKEKFSGDANYFDFLITEYYRFLEFSIIMPVAIIASGILGVAYYTLFSIRNECYLYCRVFAVFFIMLFAVCVIFILWVPPKILESYRKASHDLINGVSDFMSKGLR